MENQSVVINIDCFAETHITTNIVIKMLLILY